MDILVCWRAVESPPGEEQHFLQARFLWTDHIFGLHFPAHGAIKYVKK